MRFRSGQHGQGSVELIVAIPLIALVVMSGWQIVVAGHTWWKLHEAARLVARERYVAKQRGEADEGLARGRKLALALLGATPTKDRRVRHARSGAVTVSARVPLVKPFRGALGAGSGPLISATSRMAP